MTGKLLNLQGGVLALCFLAGAAKGSEISQMRLIPQVNFGCRIEQGSIRLFDRISTQQGKNPIVIEGEAASRIVFQEDVFARRAGETNFIQIKRSSSEYTVQSDDPSASGNGYVDYATSAAYPFAVETEGSYTVWVRHWVPRMGSWNYHHQLDDEAKQEVDLTPFIPAEKTWFWVRGQTRTLKPGTHTLFISNLMNGKRLDKIILSPDPGFTPEGLGLPATPMKEALEGRIVFEPLSLVGCARWSTFSWKGNPGDGMMEFSASFDGGKKWSPLKDGQDIQELAPASGAPLLVQAVLKRKGAAAPVIDSAYVAWIPDETRFATIRSGETRLDISKDTGAPSGLRNTATGTCLIPTGTRMSAFKMRLKTPGQKDTMWLSSEDAKLLGMENVPDKTASAKWGLLDNRVRVAFEYAAKPESGLVEWNIAVENDHPTLDVLEIVAPVLNPFRIGAQGESNILCWPYSAGEIIAEPAGRGEMSVQYIDHAGFPWLDLYTDGPKSQGFYFGMHDPQLIGTTISAFPGRDGLSSGFSFSKSHRIKAGGGKTTYRYVLAVHSGDWHWAADTYRKFFRANYPLARHPAWLRDADAWMAGRGAGCGRRVSHSGGGILREAKYSDMEWDFQNASFHGLSYIQAWGSLCDGACPTYYLPRLEKGGEEQFAAMIRSWRKIGGHIGFYFHGNALGAYYIISPTYFERPWSEYPAELRPPDWAWYEKNAHRPYEDTKLDRAALEKAAQTVNETLKSDKPLKGSMMEWGVDSYYPITWASGDFASHFLKWISRYVEKYGCDTAYLDTFSFWNSKPDFNLAQGRHGENDQPMIKHKFLDKFFGTLRAEEPGFASLTEGVADVYGTRLYYLLSGFSRQPNVMRYMLPDQIYFLGNCNGLWDEALSRHSVSRSFVYGMKLDFIVDTMPILPHSWHILKLRQRVSPFLNYAAFKDTMGVRASDPDVMAFSHIVGDESAEFSGVSGSKAMTVTVLNEKRAKGTLEIRPPEGMKPTRAYLCRLYHDPVALPFKIKDGTITTELPDAETAAIILIENVSGLMAWTAIPVQKGNGTVELSLFNFDGKPLEFRIEEKSGLTKFSGLPRTVSVAPGKLEVVRLEDTEPSDKFKTATLGVSASDSARDLIISLGKTDGVIPPVPK